MKFILLENQIERILAFKFLRRIFENSKLFEKDNLKILRDNDNEVILIYNESNKTLRILKDKIWSDIKKKTRVDINDLFLIVKSLAIDTFKLKKTDIRNLEIVNNFSDENLELVEIELKEAGPNEPTLNPSPSAQFNLNSIFNRNPLLDKFLPNKENFTMLVKDLPKEKQLDKLVDELNRLNPNYNAKKVGGNTLNLTVKNPFVDKKHQPNFPIKITGNVDLKLKPNLGLKKATLSLTIPF